MNSSYISPLHEPFLLAFHSSRPWLGLLGSQPRKIPMWKPFSASLVQVLLKQKLWLKVQVKAKFYSRRRRQHLMLYLGSPFSFIWTWCLQSVLLRTEDGMRQMKAGETAWDTAHHADCCFYTAASWRWNKRARAAEGTRVVICLLRGFVYIIQADKTETLTLKWMQRRPLHFPSSHCCEYWKESSACAPSRRDWQLRSRVFHEGTDAATWQLEFY